MKQPREAEEDHGEFWVCRSWLTMPLSDGDPASKLMAELDRVLDIDPQAKLKRGTHSLSHEYYLEYRINKAAFARMSECPPSEAGTQAEGG